MLTMLLGFVTLMTICITTHLVRDSISIPTFIVLFLCLIIFCSSGLEGLDSRYIALTLVTSFAYFILLNRFESLSGGHFEFGKSLWFRLGEIPILSMFIIAIPTVLTQNLIRNLPSSIYVKALIGSLLSAAPVVLLFYSGPFIDVMQWELLFPSIKALPGLLCLTYLLSFAGLQFNFSSRISYPIAFYSCWITFWMATLIRILN